jgi:hypothetical protein
VHGDTNNATRPIGLRPRDAAKTIGLSERKLWALTAPRGPIPCARIGTCRVYRLADLDRWLATEAAKGSEVADVL